jgi:anti-sigma factor ChrR (cupin superfamily)
MLNMSFSKRVVIDTNNQEWTASPMHGVWRKLLAREDAERGHATSIVRYEAGAKFSSHDHPLGEEIFVLQGVFSDETGDYPAGSYFRNPDGFRHAPFSKEGCVLFVKLHQFQAKDLNRICIDTKSTCWQLGINGLKIMPLYEFNNESVFLVKLSAGETFQSPKYFGGEEFFVISGEFIDEHGRYAAGSWIRTPDINTHRPFIEKETVILVKTGHI